MKQRSLMIKPASSLCNMRCAYCFYADVASNREVRSYGRMTEETLRQVLVSARRDLSAGDALTVAFQGGEPTLAGLPFYAAFFRMADELFDGVRLSVAFQTNGLLLDEAWCALFRERDVLVGLSIDGDNAMHNACRVDAGGKGTYARVRRAMTLLKRFGVRFNVLTVLTASIARHPAKVWNWIVAEGIDHIQFIPCLDALGANERSPFALTPARFCEFYAGLFPLWARAIDAGRYVSVKLFDDLCNLYLHGEPTACGITGRCALQYVVEANGDAFPCDFYVLDEYRLGSLTEHSPEELAPNGQPFLETGRAYAAEEPCKSCRYGATCGGGCKRLKDSMYLDRGVCRYAELLDEILTPLLRAARRFMLGRGQGMR